MKQIPLTQGKFALVDDEDYDFLMQWKWHINKGGYAVRIKHLKKTNNYCERKAFYMHREIMKTPDGLYTDHINGSGIDNRKENLRVCSNRENSYNSSSHKGTSSKFKGVSWYKRDKKWQVQISLNGKQTLVGRFFSEEDAARAYNSMALKFYGTFARLNKIEEKKRG